MIYNCIKCNKEYKSNFSCLRHIEICDYVSMEQFAFIIIKLFSDRFLFKKKKKKKLRKSFTKEVKAIIYTRSSGICENFINGVRCELKASPIHHLIPIRQCVEQGINQLDQNILIHLCINCHRMKHPQLPDKLFISR